MKLGEFLKENNYQLSKKGRDCLISSLKEIYPNLNIESNFTNYIIDAIIDHLEITEDDAIKILQMTSKYAKLYMFS